MVRKQTQCRNDGVSAQQKNHHLVQRDRQKIKASAEFWREWEDVTSQRNKESKQSTLSRVRDTKD